MPFANWTSLPLEMRLKMFDMFNEEGDWKSGQGETKEQFCDRKLLALLKVKHSEFKGRVRENVYTATVQQAQATAAAAQQAQATVDAADTEALGTAIGGV